MNKRPETSEPGIVVFSSSLDLLHMNKRAFQILTQFGGAASGLGAKPELTAPLHPLCQDIIEAMRERQATNKGEAFLNSRMIGNTTSRVSLKGFGLPDPRGMPHSRIVILLSPDIFVSIPGSGRMEGTAETVHLGADMPRATEMEMGRCPLRAKSHRRY